MDQVGRQCRQDRPRIASPRAHAVVRCRGLRPRIGSACVALVAYLAAALVHPALHQRHHALHGADHVHGASGTGVIHQPDAAHALTPEVVAHHAAFDADLAALDLAEVAVAGALAVDCGLAAFTGATCDEPSAGHPHNFGDELLARTHTHAPGTPPPFDPRHGAGSLEHLGASILASRTFVLAPPPRPILFVLVDVTAHQPAPVTRTTHDPRGPPPLT